MHLPSRTSTALLSWALISTTSPTWALRVLSPRAAAVLPRQDSSSSSSCAAVDAKLPSNFQCQPGNNCISLDNSSSSLCCPESDTCDNIQTISCDIQTQNATLHAGASIFTTRLGDRLPTCGQNCCPFGYACIESQQGPPICSIIPDTSKVGRTDNSQTSATKASSSTTPAPTPTSVPSSTSTATILNPATGQLQDSCNKFPIGVFLAGFFPGIFVGAFLMLAWVICTGRHRRPSSRHSGMSSVYKPAISDPIPLANGGNLRTDFLRRTTDRARSVFWTKDEPGPEPTTSHWKMPTPPEPNNIPAAPLGAPVTPDRRPAQKASAESIRIYSPPGNTLGPSPPPSVAPLRGMTAQRYPPSTSMGSPFHTPSPNNVSGNANSASSKSSHQRGQSSFSTTPSPAVRTVPEMLTPARYQGGDSGVVKRQPPEQVGQATRPTSTFTDMLHDAGFPDPLYTRPVVPKIPKAYDRSNR